MTEYDGNLSTEFRQAEKCGGINPLNWNCWIYNYLCNRYLSPTDVVGSIPAQGEVYNIMW
jgi:hypothetical protein